MDLSFITENFVPVIVVACLIVGYVIKVTPLFNKVANAYIPLIVAALGAILGGVYERYRRGVNCLWRSEWFSFYRLASNVFKIIEFRRE
mgnify:CR=1 FL=1